MEQFSKHICTVLSWQAFFSLRQRVAAQEVGRGLTESESKFHCEILQLGTHHPTLPANPSNKYDCHRARNPDTKRTANPEQLTCMDAQQASFPCWKRLQAGGEPLSVLGRCSLAALPALRGQAPDAAERGSCNMSEVRKGPVDKAHWETSWQRYRRVPVVKAWFYVSVSACIHWMQYVEVPRSGGETSDAVARRFTQRLQQQLFSGGIT